MRRKKSGFTIVEVSLFLAITALVFVGIAVGTQNSIFQQRYNDAVQNFVEFLRGAYSQVTNVQSEGDGRTGYAIYGKLVVFGGKKDGENKIKTFNVIGKIESNGSNNGGTILEQLNSRDANVIYDGPNGPTSVGIVEDYTPKWASQIQTTDGLSNNKYKIIDGALLIIRSPDTGSVNTYVYSNSGSNVGDNMLDKISENNNPFAGSNGSYLTSDYFKKEDMNFCINPNGADKSNLRRNIRIMAGARNSSSIVVVSDDESACN